MNASKTYYALNWVQSVVGAILVLMAIDDRVRPLKEQGDLFLCGLICFVSSFALFCASEEERKHR